MHTAKALLLSLSLLASGAARAVDYAALEPILRERCVLCHVGPAAPLGLRLDSRDGLLTGSQRGPVVKPGDIAGSELLRRLRGDSQPRMPMTGPPYLEPAQIALFEAWVREMPPDATPEAMASGEPAAASTVPSPMQPGSHPGKPTYLDVAPIFATRCAKCHAERGLMGAPPEGFVLTSHAQTLAHGERARVVPGNPGASELLRRIRGQARPRMPFDGPPYLSEAEIALIERWIAAGAPDSSGQPSPTPAGARVRLHGVLGAPDQLDDWRFEEAPDLRRDRRPQAGDYVELRGRVGADGSVLAERLRKR